MRFQIDREVQVFDARKMKVTFQRR